MRNKIVTVLLILFLASLYALSSFTQEQEQKSELRFVRTAVVQPSNSVEYEALIKKAVQMCGEYKVKYPWYTYRVENSRYLFVVPFENHAGIDEYYAYKNDVYQSEGWQDIVKKMRPLFESQSDAIFNTCPELTYNPENPRLKPGEDNFVRIKYITIHNGKMSEAKKVVKEMAALYKECGIADGISVLQSDIGPEFPMLVFTDKGKDRADYYNIRVKNYEKTGDKIFDIWEKFVPLIRKYEAFHSTYLPELSFIPKKK